MQTQLTPTQSVITHRSAARPPRGFSAHRGASRLIGHDDSPTELRDGAVLHTESLLISTESGGTAYVVTHYVSDRTGATVPLIWGRTFSRAVTRIAPESDPELWRQASEEIFRAKRLLPATTCSLGQVIAGVRRYLVGKAVNWQTLRNALPFASQHCRVIPWTLISKSCADAAMSPSPSLYA